MSLSSTSWCTMFNLSNENASLFMGFVNLFQGTSRQTLFLKKKPQTHRSYMLWFGVRFGIGIGLSHQLEEL